MTLKEFAKKHKLKLVGEPTAVKLLHPDGNPHPDTEHIPGKRGWVTEAGSAYDVFILRGHHPAGLIEEGKRLGLELNCHGDTEISFYFDARNPVQVKFALEAIGARKKKQLSEESIQRLREQGKRLAAMRRMPIAA